MAKVGQIYKVRMELHPSPQDALPAWKLGEVKLQDMGGSKETLRFRSHRWLSRRHDDKDVMREMPAVRPGKQVLDGEGCFVVLKDIGVYLSDVGLVGYETIQLLQT